MQNYINPNGISNDDIGQCANAINRKHNVNLLTRRLEGGRWKNMGLLAHNMITNISCDGCEGILHNIMGCRPFPTMNITKKVNPHKV
jgi:hypothetical protein